MVKKIKFIFIFILFTAVCFGQEVSNNFKKPNIKRNFYSVNLLDAYDNVIAKLKKDPLILLDPKSDFGDFDEETPDLLKAKINPYAPHIYYHFLDKKLYIISVFWDKKRFSYLEIYKKLKNKYQAPKIFNAHNTVWEDETTIIILDNLPSIKYIDKKTFEQVKSKDNLKVLQKDLIKEKLLEDL